ncbi:MAG: hypothetical protein AAGK37_14275 [Pseudomonadota bacterium]
MSISDDPLLFVQVGQDGGDFVPHRLSGSFQSVAPDYCRSAQRKGGFVPLSADWNPGLSGQL